MKIGTINIDWFKKSVQSKQFIIEKINEQDFDFLIVTENIDEFKFSENYFVYHSNPIPLDEEFEFLDYGKYLKGNQPVRTSIYSKYPSIKQNTVRDFYTSISHDFLVDEKTVTVYGTIVGTLGIQHQKDIAKKELLNFIFDVDELVEKQNDFIVAGDFNTSFLESEKRELSQINSREVLINISHKYHIQRITENITQNIDHIFISKSFPKAESLVWITEDELQDKYHKGVSIII
ncbi:hypothetical protein J2X31_002414 [Flavobacterium arsenatis]|uniref:Endonuclease/exonuclease/phosphatase domain-containing protein n=1 Tax=Flavobacterium arsenatis TaxID=1484332 RepID=A0ABU1TQX6_9FLAO|nr:endonuclease/exonuclease/phosphatase family protein [Flavobacterium arsenatis]MDR6968391.1 hypothetical protein [Flavobacterium arsenatis]